MKKSIIKIVVGVMVLSVLSLGVWKVAYAAVIDQGAVPKVTATATTDGSLQAQRSKDVPVVAATTGTVATSTAQPVTNEVVAQSDPTIFNKLRLSTMDGQNGNPAYIVVKDIVYDVSALGSWTNGQHNGYQAGTDLTRAFESSPHAMSILDKAIKIGTYDEAYVAPTTTIPVDVTTSASIKEGSTVTVPVNQTQNNVKVVEKTVPAKSTGSSQAGFTLADLKKYNGQNGNPAYIAVKGIVYDVTALGSWSGGTHKGYQAGADLTAAFAKSPHAMSILNNTQKVGVIGGTITVTNPSTQTTSNQSNQVTGQITNPKTTPTVSKNDDHDDDDDDHNDRDSHDDDNDDHDKDDDDNHDGDDD